MQICLYSTIVYLSNINTFAEYLKKMRTYAAALTPLPPPPPVYAMRTHWPRPPSPLRAYVLYG